jgi:hypothetical protein
MSKGLQILAYRRFLEPPQQVEVSPSDCKRERIN